MTARQTLVQRAARLGNRYLGVVLSNPRLVGLLGMAPVRVRYTGRRSGTTFELPAWAKVRDDGVLISVGMPSQKAWWRNFRTARPIEIRLGEQWRAGTAVVHEPRQGAVEVHVTWS